MTEAAKAKRWRDRNGLSRAALAELIGYQPTSIYWMEQGLTPPGNRGSRRSQAIRPQVWLRYRRACQAVDHELRTKRKFGW